MGAANKGEDIKPSYYTTYSLNKSNKIDDSIKVVKLMRALSNSEPNLS